ncbi:putative membrane protein [Desulfohalotomaculum tongense]|uniref:DUF2273 domain-containing protein n=1 Tax=Desulforadius tongensis TaxID=1216062 RepID=UPI0019589D55|nr:DUF2273 domain-containing protein [Desulforadius tongensis]MBM7855491.1 putative membrane protein [Desulforadius tongensis]
MGYKRFVQEILEYHRGKALGVILGLFFGWFAITYGLFKALFVTLCIAVGFFIGKRLDESNNIRHVFDRLFRDR